MLFSKTKLQYKNQDEDEYLYVDTTLALGPTVPVQVDSIVPVVDTRSTSAFLPRAEQDRKKAEQIMDAEMMIGRIAMVSALFMFGTELMSGSSLPEQINSLFM